MKECLRKEGKGYTRPVGLAERLVFEDEYAMTEEEIGEVLHSLGVTGDLREGKTSAMIFLEALARLRCKRIGL